MSLCYSFLVDSQTNKIQVYSSSSNGDLAAMTSALFFCTKLTSWCINNALLTAWKKNFSKKVNTNARAMESHSCFHGNNRVMMS